MVCLSYRGYWSSKGRPTEKGIRLDAAAALKWIHDKETESGKPVQVILWGQSIGAGVATNLAAEQPAPGNLQLNSLILETPFTSLRAMLRVLYPQRWLPYQYLWPFLRNQLDSWGNIEAIVNQHGHAASKLPCVLILQAAKDELVPPELTQKLLDRCSQLQLPADRRVISGAFHNDVMFMGEGRRAVSEFIAGQIRKAG